MSDLGFKHVFYPGEADQPVLLLLHGTGGDEHDLIDLGRAVAPGASLLSVRGKVMENGMPRFFKRLTEGVFDMDDLIARTDELADFIVKARVHYNIADKSVYALGYSNGANIAARLFIQQPAVLAGAILLRAMLPYDAPAMPDLTGKKILIASGLMDALIPNEQPQKLAELFKDAGATVELHLKPATHQLNQSDIDEAKRWWIELNK